MAQIAPHGLRLHFTRLQRAMEDAAPPEGTAHAALDDLPDALGLALQNLGAALADHFQGEPLATGPLLDFHFEVQHLLKLTDTLGSHSLLDMTHGAGGLQALSGGTASPAGGMSAADVDAPRADTDDGVCLNLRNVVPAPFMRPRWAGLHGCTLFSATLSPPDYQTHLLGLPEGTGWLDVPPVFPAEHLCVRVAERLSTRYAHRSRSLQALAQVVTRQFDAHPGNYLAFFSSHDYLQQAAEVLQRLRPDIPQWRQERTMDAASRRAFLQRFEPQGRGIGFAVLGGVFAEGVDLPGTRLIGAFVATLGLPPVSPVQEALRTRLDQLFGPDHGYADLVPAMQKVVQAAGRVRPRTAAGCGCWTTATAARPSGGCCPRGGPWSGRGASGRAEPDWPGRRGPSGALRKHLCELGRARAGLPCRTHPSAPREGGARQQWGQPFHHDDAVGTVRSMNKIGTQDGTGSATVGGICPLGGGPVRRPGRALIRSATSSRLHPTSLGAPNRGFHARGRVGPLMND
jgi:hypothetical protein